MVNLPSMKTIIESKEDGTKAVWFKYENVSDEFVQRLNDQIHENIWAVNVSGVANFPIPLPEEEQGIIDTLVDTVKLFLNKESALAFIKANVSRVDAIGYLPLIWAASKYLGSNQEAVAAYLEENKGREKAVWEEVSAKLPKQ